MVLPRKVRTVVSACTNVSGTIHTRQSGISLMLRSMGQKSVVSYFGNACKSSLLVAGKGESFGVSL